MTIQASRRAAANNRRGKTAEQTLVRWLRGNGFPHAERTVRTGHRVGGRARADEGDVTGTPGVVWSVKDCATERIPEWFTELDAMSGPRGCVRLLVVKRRGYADPGRWWVWLRLADLEALTDGCPGEAGTATVRLDIAAVVVLLRTVGHGTQLGEVS